MTKRLLLILALCLPAFVYGQAPTSTSRIPLSFAYDQDAQILFRAMTTPPTEARKFLIDKTIKELKQFGIWYQLDVLHVYAAETQQAALLNWIKRSHDGTAVNSPTFAANAGFTGDGATSYINTNYNAATQGVKYSLNSATVGAYVRGTAVSAGQVIGWNNGAAFTQIAPRFTGDITIMRHNSAGSSTPASNNASGFWVIDRASSAAFTTYRNGSSFSSHSTASTAVASFNAFVLARNTANTPDSFFSLETSAALLGGSLSAEQQYHFNRIIEAYLDAVGAGVQ